jgi:hypothetical protein
MYLSHLFEDTLQFIMKTAATDITKIFFMLVISLAASGICCLIHLLYCAVIIESCFSKAFPYRHFVRTSVSRFLRIVMKMERATRLPVAVPQQL